MEISAISAGNSVADAVQFRQSMVDRQIQMAVLKQIIQLGKVSGQGVLQLLNSIQGDSTQPTSTAAAPQGPPSDRPQIIDTYA